MAFASQRTVGPVRVAHVMGKMVGGGVEAVVMNYYRHIDRSRVQFDFLVDEDSAFVPREEIGSLGGRVFEVPPYQRPFAYARSLESLFADEGWPIVHSHVNALSVVPLRGAARAGVPVRIAHSHSTAGKGEPVKNALKRLLRTQANRYPTHRLACSRYAGEWLFGEGAGFDVLYNAIELDRFPFNAEVRAEARADLGLVGDELAVGHVGRFMAQKNHTFLLDAFAEVAARRPDAVLLLVGAGELRSFVECRAAERGLAGRVRFLGQRDDVERLYQAFDAFALPSLYEGLGLVGVEAQRAGLPCLLSDAITREVDVTGTVRFLPIDEPSAWADALCALRAGERVPVRPESFSDYDIDAAAGRLAERYLDLVAGSLR